MLEEDKHQPTFLTTWQPQTFLYYWLIANLYNINQLFILL